MNWVEILMLLVGGTWGSYKACRWIIKHDKRKQAEARAAALCTDGCGAAIDQDTDVLFKGRWYKPACWRSLNS